MAPEFDLTNLSVSDADLWICLQADTLFGQIMADQGTRLGFSPELGISIASALVNKPQGIFNNG